MKLFNRNRGALLLGALVVWLSAGFATKATRYFPEPTDSKKIRTEASLENYLATLGWRPDGRDRITANGMYEVLRYAKAGCPGAALRIAVLGNSREALEATRLRLGDEVAYLEAGQLAAEPQFKAFEARAVAAAALQRLGGPRDNVLPILAIGPWPVDAEGRCALPTVANWAAFDRLP